MAPRIGSRSKSLRAELQDQSSLISTGSQADSDVLTDQRGMRSGAPSAVTQTVQPRLISSSALAEASQQEENPMLMEMRNVMKDESDSDVVSAIASVGSFIGPNMALKDFGRQLKATLDALAEIQALGVSHVVELPELVLVGDQSSGKSSLMSAIAGISLPRSSGTCTRCPLHIRISKAREWSCQVYLKQDYEFQPPSAGHIITIDDVTKNNKFPPWKPLPVKSQARQPFKTVQGRFDPEELETVLQCAQVAILNPSTPFSFFIPKLKGEAPDATRIQHAQRVKEQADNAEALFSPNTVALVVEGPDLADLNFYDLPGVFITAKRPEDRFLERVVRNLTSDYISRPNAIILGAVPMNNDTENSYAFKLIRESKAEHRCVGVMTKADLLPRDTEASKSWLSMLDEKTHRIGLGYFITSRQEGDLEAQNKREEAFFNRTPDFDTHGWPQSFDPFRDRCGVEKLKAFLSIKLGEEFSKVIPEVKLKVNRRLHHLGQQLNKYPDQPANPEMEIMRALSQFSTGVKARLQQRDFMAIWDRDAAEPFRSGILLLKPRFNLSEPSTKVVIDLCGPSDNSSHDISMASTTSTASRKRQFAGLQTTPSKRPRGDSSSVQAEDLTPASSYTFPRSGSVVPISLPTVQPPRSKDLLTIRKLIKQSARPGQPGHISADVFEPLYIESARLWIRYLDVYVEQTIHLLRKEIMQILGASFQTLNTRAVFKESKRHMENFILQHEQQLRDQLLLLYRLESRHLFTKDVGALELNKASEKRILERHRYYCRMAARNGVEVGPITKVDLMTDDDLAKEAVTMQKDLKTLGPDPYDQELTVAVHVRGFYVTAANRFIDSACIHFMSGLLPEISELIEKYLDEKLGLTPGSATEEVIAHLVSEDDENAKKREELKGEKRRFDQSLEILEKLTTENLETRPATPRTANGHANAPALHGLHRLSIHANGGSSRSNGRSGSQRSGSVTRAGPIIFDLSRDIKQG